MKAVLGLPAYRRLLTAYTLNELAFPIAEVSLAFLIYHRTGSAVGAMAFFLAAQFVPALIAPGLVAKLDQRAVGSVLPVLYGLEGLAYLALAWVASRFLLAPILVLVLFDGLLAQTARALARSASVAVTAPKGLLREGNALTNAAFSICWMVGPALGGAVVTASAASTALLVNSCLFAVIGVTLVTADTLPGAVGSPLPSAGRLRAALAHARSEPAIRALLGLQAASVLVFTIATPVEVVLIQRSLHSGDFGYGALLSTWGTGAIAGSLVYSRWRRLPARQLIAAGTFALGVGFTVMASAPSLAVALVGAAFGGAGNGVQAVSARTALQEQVDQGWMARIMSLNESIFQAMPGGGILIGGAIAALSGARIALAVAAAGAFVVTSIVWLVLRPAGVVGEPAGASGHGAPSGASGLGASSGGREGSSSASAPRDISSPASATRRS